MKALLRQGIDRIPAPWPVYIEDAYRLLRYPRIRGERRTQNRVIRKLADPSRVAQGPFQGMRYVSRAYCSTILPKLLGTYERELGAAVEALCRAQCDRIVDIGAAEGYYAVGMALRNRDAVVICFERNASARYFLRRLARKNGVLGRVQIHGECTAETLAAALDGAKRPAVICDCEGAEGVLLDPLLVPPLLTALILVETHEGMVPGVEQTLLGAFAPTHEIQIILSRERSREDLPPGVRLSADEVVVATDEYRRRAEWMFMRLKSAAPTRGTDETTGLAA